MRKIICIGRQFGSGGHLIAKEFARKVGITYYDKKILKQAAEISGIDEKILEKAEEKTANPLLHSIYYQGSSKEYFGKNANDILFQVQKNIVLDWAQKEDCVIVGRCADVILKENTDYAVKSIFMAAPMEYRIHNTMEIDGLSEKKAASRIRKADKKRSAYYNFYTGHDWGKISDYDLCINTAEAEEEEIVNLLEYIYQSMK